MHDTNNSFPNQLNSEKKSFSSFSNLSCKGMKNYYTTSHQMFLLCFELRFRST